MRRPQSHRLLPLLGVICALLITSAPATAGGWCRGDPLLTIDNDVVDIQVGSSLAMYQAADGPIEMVVTVPPGTQANVLLRDFGFGHGYAIRIVHSDALAPGVRASAAMRAPAGASSRSPCTRPA